MASLLRTTALAVSLLLAVLAVSGCARQPEITALRGATMATRYTVRIADPVDRADSVAGDVQATLDGIESAMSTYIADSEVSLFNASTSDDWLATSRATCSVVEIALAVSRQSDGAFDITVGPLVDLWGFGPGGNVAEPPAAEQVAAARERTGFEYLSTDCARPALRKSLPALAIDLSAVAKGYAADAVAELLDALGYRNYLVEIGGEMRIRGAKRGGEAWRVGIEAPVRERLDVYGALEVSDGAVATSGDYRNYFEKDGRYYSHTIDPRTGAPVTHPTGAVTVLAGSAAYADAMATALLVLGSEDGLELAERENIAALFLIRTADGIDSIASSAFETYRRDAATTRETQ